MPQMKKCYNLTRAFPVNESPLAETIILNTALSSTPSSNPFFLPLHRLSI